MSFGAGIFLFVVGAILAFAVNVSVAWANLHLIGYILMGAGILGIILGFALMFRKQKSLTVTRNSVDPANSEQVISHEKVVS